MEVDFSDSAWGIVIRIDVDSGLGLAVDHCTYCLGHYTRRVD